MNPVHSTWERRGFWAIGTTRIFWFLWRLFLCFGSSYFFTPFFGGFPPFILYPLDRVTSTPCGLENLLEQSDTQVFQVGTIFI